MSWKVYNDQAMEALMDGKNDEAIRLWKESVKSIEEAHVEASIETGHVYYYLGKCLSDSGLTEEAVCNMMKAESILTRLEPEGETLRQCKYHLGAALNLKGDHDSAVGRFRDALGFVERPLPEILQGNRTDDLEIEDAIKALQKVGLAKQLNKKELARIHAHLVEIGRADEGETESMHPFDVLFEYYENDARRQKDNCISFENFELEEDIEQLLEKLNAFLGLTVFEPADLAFITGEKETTWYLTVDKDEEGPAAAALSQYESFDSVIDIYNCKLMLCDDERRFLRLSSYDDRRAVILLDINRAAALFKNGTQHIFEDLPADLEPTPPDLVRLAK